jgi:uncharacterized protein (DUF3820 family)
VDACRHCGSLALFTVRCESPSPHYARTGCRACGRFLRWEPAPMTPERAAGFVMPFGKHQGKTLGELAETPSGRSYLEWLRIQDRIGGSMHKAIDAVLGPHPEPA